MIWPPDSKMCSLQHSSAEHAAPVESAQSRLSPGRRAALGVRWPHGGGQKALLMGSREKPFSFKAENVKPAEAEAGGVTRDFRISLPPLLKRAACRAIVHIPGDLHMNFRTSTSKDTSLEAGGGVFVWGRLLTCISFRELWVIIWSWCVWQRQFWIAPMFQAQLVPRLWSSPNSILNFQFGPCLNLKLDEPVKSHPQALRKPHSSSLSVDMFLGKSLWTCCQRCHQTL